MAESKLKYAMRVFGSSKFSTLREVTEKVHARSGKSRAWITADIINCAIRYGAGYHDYLIFGWETIPAKNRDTYLTRMRNKKFIDKYNDASLNGLFGDKSAFNKRFQKFLKREFLSVRDMTEENLAAFVEGKEIIFAKPDSSESGKGIERLVMAEHPDIKELFAYLKDPAKNFGLIEQELIQHPEMSKLYPKSVNTLRINTLVGDDGAAHCLYATCKMGNLGKFVDNMENDGLSCPVDLETGKICGVAHTSKLINYDTHPYTGVKLIGYQIPYLHEAVAMAEEAALVEPRMRYLGWDVAITPDGPAIIEANNFPGYDFSQLPEHTPDRIGTLAAIRKYVSGI
jgi:hypothetical protein